MARKSPTVIMKTKTTMKATALIRSSDMQHWTKLLRKKKVDYSKNGLFKFSTPFKASATFLDGKIADVMVCADNPESGALFVQAVLYNQNGYEIYRAEPSHCLDGAFRLYDDGNLYELTVKKCAVDDCGSVGGYYGNQPWMYTLIGRPRHDFVELIDCKLTESISSDYTTEIAEKIADDVAQDICDTADANNWSEGDLRLAIGRVLLKAVENTYNEEK